MNDYSMLAYIAPRSTNRIEDLATDALLYLLRTYGEISASFYDLLIEMGCRLPKPLKFDTQKSLKTGAIPDLRGMSEDDEIALLVEAKFGAEFTPNQPLAYVENISVDNGGAVIILAPGSRHDYLWSEVMEKCTDIGIILSNHKGDPPQWETARLENDLALGFLSWGFLLENLNAISNELALQELFQLSGLVRRLEDELFEPFQADELLTTSDQRREQFREIVSELVQTLSQTKSFSTEDYSVGRGPDYYRRYGTFAGRRNWCIEYSEQYASKHEYSFIWLSGPWDDDFNEIVDKDEGEGEETVIAFRDEKRLAFPLIVPLDAAKPVILRSLLDQIHQAGKAIGQVV